MQANVFRQDLIDVKLHPTGHAGFRICRAAIPDLTDFIDDIEIRDATTGVLLFRNFREDQHLPAKVLRFEMQAMPYASIEAAWSKHFSLYYNAIERYPFETLFGILNNPVVKSIALSGRPNLARYEQLFRDREYKLVTLLRDPYEELAERLLFYRYALSPSAPARFKDHLSDLSDLRVVTQRFDPSNLPTLAESFAYLSDRQLMDLSNPLVRALACTAEDPIPRTHHVEIALGRLATFDLVGTRVQFDIFKNSLGEIAGAPILKQEELVTMELLKPIAEELKNIKIVRSLLSLDSKLYEFSVEAVRRALSTSSSSQKRARQLHHAQ
ncbi:MAG TPA: hypothetical protein PL193_05855 [Xanthobacteraceae bacterium]|nr:hypothetical protein [Xanthobacteraceae bacterium]